MTCFSNHKIGVSEEIVNNAKSIVVYPNGVNFVIVH